MPRSEETGSAKELRWVWEQLLQVTERPVELALSEREGSVKKPFATLRRA